MKGLLIVGGRGPGRRALAECRDEAKLVIAADSGLESALSLGVEPDLVVGDMDSLKDTRLLERFPPERKVIFPREKDETDTEIGLRLMRERGIDDVVIAGGGGGRIDHLLAIAMLFERDFPPRRWVTDGEDIRLIDGEAELTGWRGSTVSLFPLGEGAADMHSEGLKWPLDGLELRRGFAGVSNVVTGERLWIRVDRGKLLLIRQMSEVH